MSWFYSGHTGISVWTDEPHHHVSLMWHNKVMTALRGRDQQSCSEGEDAADSSGVVVCHHHLTITLMCLYLASGGGHADTENIQSHLAFLKVLLFSFFQSRGKNILYWLMKQQLHPKFHLGAVMFLGSLIIIFFLLFFCLYFCPLLNNISAVSFLSEYEGCSLHLDGFLSVRSLKERKLNYCVIWDCQTSTFCLHLSPLPRPARILNHWQATRETGWPV